MDASMQQQTPLCSKRVTWSDTSRGGNQVYTFHLALHQNVVHQHKACHVEAVVTFRPDDTTILTGDTDADQTIHSFVAESDPIGYLDATLLSWKRTQDDDFYWIAHTLGPDLYQLSTMFCDKHGVPRSTFDSNLATATTDDEDERGTDNENTGGFLHIRQVEIHPRHARKNLGIRLIQEVLIFLDQGPKNWAIAVMIPKPLGCHCQWFEQGSKTGRRTKQTIPKSRKRKRRGSDAYDKDKTASNTKCLSYDLATLKLNYQFGRLGFQQAGKSPDQYFARFLTHKTYFKGSSSSIPHPWTLISERSQQLAAAADYFPPRRPAMHKRDRVLLTVLDDVDTLFSADFLNKDFQDAEISCKYHQRTVEHEISLIEEGILPWSESRQEQIDRAKAAFSRFAEVTLKRKKVLMPISELLDTCVQEIGCSIDGSCALHRCTMMVTSSSEVFLLDHLITLGANVNHQDVHGRTALHVAAETYKYYVIQYLLSAGADPFIRDKQQQTPLECLLKRRRLDMIYEDTLHETKPISERRLPPLPANILPMYESIQLLQSSLAKKDDKRHQHLLVDGWLPPRMIKMLVATAEKEYSRLVQYMHQFPRDHDLTLMNTIAYKRVTFIPLAVVSRICRDKSKGKQYSFRAHLEGHALIWACILRILRMGRSPTVLHIRAHLTDLAMANETYESFVKTGGKIEFVVDALLRITENVWQGKQDGLSLEDTDMEGLPTSPLDDLYDIAWFMCVSCGNGTWSDKRPRGPYKEDWDRIIRVVYGADEEDDG
jgi:hypothetical protein